MKTIVLVAFFTICYVVCMDLVNKYMSSIDFEKIEEEKEVSVSSSIYTVSISGMVVNPGTYTVTKDSNMGYLITLAGGLNENADVTAFNSNAFASVEPSFAPPAEVYSITAEVIVLSVISKLK